MEPINDRDLYKILEGSSNSENMAANRSRTGKPPTRGNTRGDEPHTDPTLEAIHRMAQSMSEQATTANGMMDELQRKDRRAVVDNDNQTRPQYQGLSEFKSNNPPVFLGGSNLGTIERWIQQIEKIFRAMICTEEQKAIYGTFMLQGEAENWWNGIKTSLVREGELITWEIFKAAFMHKYFPESIRMKKESEFLRLQQGNMSVSEYVAKFDELARYSKYLQLQPDDVWKSEKFEQGLRQEILNQVGALAIKNYADLVNRCLLVEQNLTRISEDSIDQTKRKGNVMHKYFPESIRMKKESEFLRLQQGNMSVSQYVAKFDELARYSKYLQLQPDDAWKSEKFEQGLRQEILNEVGALAIKNYADLVNRCLLVEQNLTRISEDSIDQTKRKGNVMHKYFPESIRMKKESEFLLLQQGNMSVSQYVAKFDELARYSKYLQLKLDDAWKSEKFEQGLRQEILNQVRALAIENYADLVNRCLLVEQNLTRISEDNIGQTKRKGNFISNLKNNAIKKPNQGKLNRNVDRTRGCPQCGKNHMGPCLQGMCFRCRQLEHFIKDCQMNKPSGATSS